jgi:hypothetical protein
MPTYSDKDIIDKLIKNEGQWRGDPDAIAIYSYNDMGGKSTFYVCYSKTEVNRFLAAVNQTVFKPVVLWQKSSAV